MNKYYVQWEDGSLGGQWCVFMKRKWFADKKVADFSVYVHSDGKAQAMAVRAKIFYEEQEEQCK